MSATRKLIFCTVAAPLILCSWRPSEASGQDNSAQAPNIKQVVASAFATVHDEWSSDEVVLQQELNDTFVKECQKQLPNSTAAELNWTLLNLRKAGKLSSKATRQDRRDYSSITPIAEICARMMEDKHSVSTDRIMCDPKLRQQFDEAAKRIDADVDSYLVRKAAFRLRKTRRLRPELITRIADWGRVVTQHDVPKLVESPDLIPTNPGIYIFRDATGYLYIGEAINLRTRLKQHLDASDSKSLANYLKSTRVEKLMVEVHAFDPESRARELMVRRAYESELIRSRKPKFNIRP